MYQMAYGHWYISVGRTIDNHILEWCLDCWIFCDDRASWSNCVEWILCLYRIGEVVDVDHWMLSLVEYNRVGYN